jgi:hypothetical protein
MSKVWVILISVLSPFSTVFTKILKVRYLNNSIKSIGLNSVFSVLCVTVKVRDESRTP